MKSFFACILFVTSMNSFAADLSQAEILNLYNLNTSLQNIKDSINKVTEETSQRLEQEEKLHFYELRKSLVLESRNCGAIAALFELIKISYADQFEQHLDLLEKIDSKKLLESTPALHLFDDKNMALTECSDIKVSLKGLKQTVKGLDTLIEQTSKMTE